MGERVWLFDTTLRDGAQTLGVSFSLADKIQIAEALDLLGVDYIEGGFPGANPVDDAFFSSPPTFERARFTAFGMTRRAGRSTGNDPGLQGVLAANTPAVCLVGKAWDFHVELALEVSRDENIAMIADSMAHVVARGSEAMFDCRTLLRRLQGRSGVCACLHRGGPRGGCEMGGALRYQRRDAARRGGRDRERRGRPGGR